MGWMQFGGGLFSSRADFPGHGVLQEISLPYASWVVAAPASCPSSHFLRRLQEISVIRTLGGDTAGLLFRRCWHIQLKSLQAFFGRSLTESALGNTTTPS